MSKKRILIGKNQISDHYQVDDDGIVSQKEPNVTLALDMSDYSEPLMNQDAINWDLPYNQANATREIYDRLDTRQAKEDAASIKQSIRILANPVADAADYLRIKHQQLYDRLMATKYGATVINTSRSQLGQQIADHLFTPLPFGDDPSYQGWAEFLGANGDLIDAYRQIYNDWLLMRWLQRLIYYTERRSFQSVLYAPQPKATLHSQADQEEAPLSLRQIALLHIFQDRVMTKNNADQKAQEYGHTSGEKLMKYYDEFKIPANRLQLDGKRIRPMIKDMTAIIPQLSGEQQARLTDEVNLLRRKI